MLFLLLVALHNIRWGARAPHSPIPLFLIRSRYLRLILIFMSYRVGGGVEHRDFDVAYLFAISLRPLPPLYYEEARVARINDDTVIESVSQMTARGKIDRDRNNRHLENVKCRAEKFGDPLTAFYDFGRVSRLEPR